ncbi:Elongation factor 4 [Frankliniella fusca]|uniref:Elongation factor 4 n=1 Tax=Frankliniella fusca TaxID=407009 RepID=A0AAE1HNF2_9NEOP|nr:Elongation factor 4 [Frankliniella fusca]
MQHVLFLHNPPSVSISEACNSAADQLLPFWARGGIPTVSKQQVVVKLRSVFNEWNELKRSKSRPSSERRERFIASLDRLFDIGVKDESKIELQEDRDFYRSMKKDRKARMSSVDVKWVQKKTKKMKRLQGQKRLKRRSDEDTYQEHI